mmetsp:Transcript_15224/g.61211  ORF Transcript_15224/g.61211 Transcript_15224/m.61211 type:complete len:134 (+) Transcript_15224:397-798(+)
MASTVLVRLRFIMGVDSVHTRQVLHVHTAQRATAPAEGPAGPAGQPRRRERLVISTATGRVEPALASGQRVFAHGERLALDDDDDDHHLPAAGVVGGDNNHREASDDDDDVGGSQQAASSRRSGASPTGGDPR